MIYINSGNAVFASDTPPDTAAVRHALEAHAGFDIPTLVLPSSQIQSIAAAIPSEWTNDAPNPDKSGNKSDVLYLFPEFDTPKSLELIGYKPDIETMRYVQGALITTVTRANQSRGSLQKITATPLYRGVTIRNVNTARKLAELAR